jgi:hypothetical protein
MTAVTQNDILLRAGGSTLLRYGVPFLRYRRDGSEPEKYTFTRADSTTCATYVDADGYLRTAAAGKLRLQYTDTALVGSWGSPGFLLESSRTNLCLQSENFGTTWTAVGTPTRSAAAVTCGALSLDLIGDDAAGALEGYGQTIVFTGNAVKAVSLFVQKGTSTSSVIYLEDASAAATRLRAVVTWNGAAASVTMVTGTLLRSTRLSGNVYRLEFQTAAVTAANTNNLYVYPATDSALAVSGTGNIYVGGVQAENAPYPSSYIKTTTGTVTRAADYLVFPIGFPPQDLTIYAKVIRPAYADVNGSATEYKHIVNLGTNDADLIFEDTTQKISFTTFNPTTYPAGGTISASAQWTAASVAAATVKIDTGSGLTSPVTYAAASAWTANKVTLGAQAGGTSNHLDGVLIDCLIARGATFTRDELAAAI